MTRMSDDDAPNWMPAASARGLPEGERRYSSVGQLWQVRDGQWVRIKKPELIIPGKEKPGSLT